MDVIDTVIMLFSVVVFIIGVIALIKGNIVKLNIGSRKQALLVLLLSFVLLAVGAALTPNEQAVNNPEKQAALSEQTELYNNQTSTEPEEDIKSVTDSPSTSSPTEAKTTSVSKGNLKVHFIDVGQADSILIQAPNGKNVLIDAGNNEDSSLVVNYLKNSGVTKIDFVIGTHPHEDHIGGLDVVIKTFQIGEAYLPKVSHTTQTYTDLLNAIQSKGLKVKIAKASVPLDIGDGINAYFIAPNSTSYDDLNNYSAVLKLRYGNTSFLFAGDAEEESESEMLLNSVVLLKADVLKVGHHGSSSSTLEGFLSYVSPRYAVISAGKDNSYGHPHVETLNKLAKAGVQVFRTDEQGTLIATSDGTTITFNKRASPIQERAPTTATTQPKDVTTKPTPAPITTEPSGVVRIIGIDLRAEVVTIKNTGLIAIDLSGWQLVSETGNQSFTFPPGTTIEAGGTLKVISNSEAVSSADALIWSKANMWNNNGDPGALYNASGKLVSRYE